MGFRFFRSLRILPGVRVNFSKTGVSLSLGKPGASLTVGKEGATGSVGVPGSGLSFRQKLFKWRERPPRNIG